MRIVASLLAGFVFGLGLVISGMSNPEKVINFLDLTGRWDPSLAFVMGGAIAVAAPGFWMLGKRAKPLFAEVFNMPTKVDLDRKLLTGAATFGIGWGLGGFCPGPALTSVSLVSQQSLVFVLFMFVGMAVARFIASRPEGNLAQAAE